MIDSKMQVEWVIIFLIYSDLRFQEDTHFEETKDELKRLKPLLRLAPLSASNKLYIVENQVSLDIEKDKITISEIRYKSQLENSDERICELTMESITKNESLLSLVFNIIDIRQDTKNILLFTWDHGSAYGIFKREDDFTKENFSNIRTQLVTNRSLFMNKMPEGLDFKQIRNDKKITNILTNEELSIAIETGFKKKKIDVLIMMNCAVQNLHTSYALRNSVDYLVAPETLIYMRPGYNYNEIFLKLRSQNNAPLEVANHAIISFTKEPFNTQFKKMIDRTALFAVRPSKSTEIITLVDRFCIFIIPLIDIDRPFWAKVFKFVYDRTFKFDQYDYYLVDLSGFLNKLLEKLNKEKSHRPEISDIIKYINQLLELFINFLKEYNINSRIGPNIYNEAAAPHPIEYYGIPVAAAVYFPDTYIESEDFSRRLPLSSSFFKNTMWGSFIQFLYKKT